MHRKSLIIIISVSLLACQPFSQTIDTDQNPAPIPQQPKLIDEFKVDDLTVRAYDHFADERASWATVYGFPVYDKEGEYIRAIVIEWHNHFGIKGYFLEESSKDWHVTYDMYEQKPSYEDIKAAVIELLTPPPETEE